MTVAEIAKCALTWCAIDVFMMAYVALTLVFDLKERVHFGRNNTL